MLDGSIAKLSMPRPVEISGRERVTSLIGRNLQAGAVWITAPGGYGKTTAVVDFIQNAGNHHIWYRVDEEDQDVGRIFFYLAQTAGIWEASLPVFGPEYAEEPLAFARLFFRAYFAHVKPDTILVLDDIHRADSRELLDVLAILVRELPAGIRCIFISRTLPAGELAEMLVVGKIPVISQRALEFSEDEARQLLHVKGLAALGEVNLAAARGWAVALVMMANESDGAAAALGASAIERGDLQEVVGKLFLQQIRDEDVETLVRLNVFPEINSRLADALLGPGVGGPLIERLFRMQLLVTRSGRGGFVLHDLLREYLAGRFSRLTPCAQRDLRKRAAIILRDIGAIDAAVPLAIEAGAWGLAREMIDASAETILEHGRRGTVIEWANRFPPEELDGWLCHWAGAAHVSDDARAEKWFEKAWDLFDAVHDLRGKWLTVTRAVLVKTGSWRTHQGLDRWTRRAADLLRHPPPDLSIREKVLTSMGMLRAIDYGDHDAETLQAGARLADEVLMLLKEGEGISVNMRILASEALVDHAVWAGRQDIFENAVDAVITDLANPELQAWTLGPWLVTFGSASGRYFDFSRRGFPFANAEEALRRAVEIGEREALRSVEFGGLYHLQLLLKLRNDFREFERVVKRLSAIADSRFTTQVAVVADCLAALHVYQGKLEEAYRDCDRFMAAIEEANEPLVERWPHYVTKFQVLIADRRPDDAIALLQEIVDRLEGGPRERLRACIATAEALKEKWEGGSAYPEKLAAVMALLRTVNSSAVLLNRPDLFASLLADALELGIEPDLCEELVRVRHLEPPSRRPEQWPWDLRIRVLGGFSIEVGGQRLDLGTKAPTRALDVLRILAISKANTCSLERLHDLLWPDLDGDQAKAACEQAIHRLRRVLGTPDLIVQREGRVFMPMNRVWVDLNDWEARAQRALSMGEGMSQADKEAVLCRFAGPLLYPTECPSWAAPVADRVRDLFVSLSVDVGYRYEVSGEGEKAREAYRHILDFYPDSVRAYEALIRERVAQRDPVGAVAHLNRYRRTGGEISERLSAVLKNIIPPS